MKDKPFASFSNRSSPPIPSRFCQRSLHDMPNFHPICAGLLQICFLERVFAMRFCGKVVFLFAALIIPARAAERINHAGRILGPMPVVTNAILFNTPEADAVMAGLQVFPRDNAWNEDISRRPLLANSDAMIAQIFSELNAVGTNSPKLRAF